MKTVVFADEQISSTLNRQFVPLELNLTQQGFPEDLPGLEPWREAYQKDWKHQVAFATSVVLFPDGKRVLGTSGCGHRWELDTSLNYDPEKYGRFLRECDERHQRARQLLAAGDRKGLRELSQEITRQCRQANTCRKP